MQRVLFVLTSHDRLGDTGRSTGFYAGEAAHPHAVLAAAGIAVEFASPRGGQAPVTGLDNTDAVQRAFFSDPATANALANTIPANRIDPSRYAGLLFVGGHGTMWDLPGDPYLAAAAAHIWEAGGVVAAVCHGPAGLLGVRQRDGTALVAGRRVAAFTEEEERAVGLEGVVPFALARQLKAAGAIHVPAPNFQANVVVDGWLVTGQNPASAHEVGVAMVKLLKASAAQAPREAA